MPNYIQPYTPLSFKVQPTDVQEINYSAYGILNMNSNMKVLRLSIRHCVKCEWVPFLWGLHKNSFVNAAAETTHAVASTTVGIANSSDGLNIFCPLLSMALPHDPRMENVPILKRGNMPPPRNYSLTSLTSTRYKFLERIIHLNVSSLLERNYFLCGFKHGFFKTFSANRWWHIYSRPHLEHGQRHSNRRHFFSLQKLFTPFSIFEFWLNIPNVTPLQPFYPGYAPFF